MESCIALSSLAEMDSHRPGVSGSNMKEVVNNHAIPIEQCRIWALFSIFSGLLGKHFSIFFQERGGVSLFSFIIEDVCSGVNAIAGSTSFPFIAILV